MNLLTTSTPVFREKMILRQILLLFIAMSFMIGKNSGLASAESNICGSDVSNLETKTFMFNLTREVKFYLPTPSENGTSIEYVFETADPDKFLTLKFTKFQLGGPDCDENSERYSKVMVESRLNQVVTRPLLFCKGRRTPDPASSMGKLRFGYCDRYTSGSVEFIVTADLLARKNEKEVTVKKNNEVCSITLTSLVEGITAEISDLEMKRSRTIRCKTGYVIIKSVNIYGEELSLLPEKRDKLCKVGDNDLDNFRHFKVHTDLHKIKIEFKKAEFKIKFKSENYELTTEAKMDSITTSTYLHGATGNNSVENYMNNNEDDETGDYTHIIALGCGGIFVLIVIILTLIFVRRKSGNSKCKRRKSKGSRSTRVSSVKYSQTTTGVTGIMRNPSIESVNNAMYGQLVGVDDTATRKTKKGHKISRKSSRQRRQNDEEDLRRRRLAELDDKYGPFLETSVNYPESHYVENKSFSVVGTTLELPAEGGLFRKGTRPLLPVPATMSTFGASCAGNNAQDKCATGNLYETIGGAAARASYITVTSDEFSDCDDLSGAQYNSILQSACIDYLPTVSYDPVEGDEEIIQTVQYTTNNNSTNGDRVQSVKYKDIIPQEKPTIDISYAPESPPPISISNQQTRHCKMNIPARLHGSGGVAQEMEHINIQYLAPRPSLPVVMPSNRYLAFNQNGSGSLDSLLQEDAEKYLTPRPSCPDAMVVAYSSTEDISDMRSRLLAAAHPSLLENNEDRDSETFNSSANKPWYDSPRPSQGEIEATNCSRVQYSTPRRNNIPPDSSL
uniref:uncharacterized protein LOC120343146 isoform X2 n=1 Tax=Styela clava TaxID=7725 RepID=UPI001939D3CB|nr:uncharacterized protein LOC120343146 isoform X2 [Styela clava]